MIVPADDPRIGKKVVDRPTLRYNNYGFSFGGPIIKDKFFFFGGLEWKSIRRFTGSTRRTIPTRAERLGDFSLRLAGVDRIPGTADDGFLRDPQRTGNCNSSSRADVPGNIIPAGRIITDGKAFASVYEQMEKLAVAYTDTPTANNALYQQPNPFDVRQDILRLDYTINDKHSVYGRYIHDNYDLVAPFGTFIDSELPTIPTNRLRPASVTRLDTFGLSIPGSLTKRRSMLRGTASAFRRWVISGSAKHMGSLFNNYSRAAVLITASRTQLSRVLLRGMEPPALAFAYYGHKLGRQRDVVNSKTHALNFGAAYSVTAKTKTGGRDTRAR